MNQSGTIQEFIRREVLSIIVRSRRCGYAQLYLIDDLSACAEALSQVTGGRAELILRGWLRWANIYELCGSYQGLIYAGGVFYAENSRDGDNRYCALGAPDH